MPTCKFIDKGLANFGWRSAEVEERYVVPVEEVVVWIRQVVGVETDLRERAELLRVELSCEFPGSETSRRVSRSKIHLARGRSSSVSAAWFGSLAQPPKSPLR